MDKSKQKVDKNIQHWVKKEPKIDIRQIRMDQDRLK